MINVRVQELEAIAEILNKELRLHEAWRDQLHRTLICHLDPADDDLAEDADQRCEFGKWFYSAQNAALRALPMFKNIERLHQDMHEQARLLCATVKDNAGIGPDEYDPFLRALQQFRDELHQIRGRVFGTLRKIDALTGVFCSAELAPDLKRISLQQQERGKPCSLLRLQFDLGNINKSHGWEAGDRVLSTCLGRLKAALSDLDRIYRHTGGDFIICLPDKAPNQVERIKDLLFHTVKEATEHALLVNSQMLDDGTGLDEADVFAPAGNAMPVGGGADPGAASVLTLYYAIQAFQAGADIKHVLKHMRLTAYEIAI